MITCFCGNFDKNSQQKTVKNQRSLLEMPLWFFNTVIGRNPGKILNVNALLTSAEALKRNVLTIRQAVGIRKIKTYPNFLFTSVCS